MSRWIVPFLLVALLGWVTLNTIRSDSPGSHGLPAGAKLPPFAMPLSSSTCRGRCDANVAVRAGQGAAGERPACSVRGPHVLNSCELAERGPVVLALTIVFARRGGTVMESTVGPQDEAALDARVRRLEAAR